MSSFLRKLLILLAALAFVLVIYTVYSLTANTPAIRVERVSPVAGGNDVNTGGETGRIANVTVGKVEQNRYERRDAAGDIVRVFGFAELLHKVEDLWEIRKPYMILYRPSFECRVKADRGQVAVETAVGRPTAKDATFTGNVEILIVPTADSKVKESVLHLDDVVFLSEKSEFSTAGPVRFDSADAKMRGRGLELVFNEESERIEFARVVHLERLDYRGPKSGLFGDAGKESSGEQALNAGAASREPKAPGQAANAAVKKAAGGVVGAGKEKVSAGPSGGATEKAGVYYRCVLRKNVLIETNEQVVFAKDEVMIRDILWSQGTSGEPKVADVNHPTEADVVAAGDRKGRTEAASAGDGKGRTEAASAGDANSVGSSDAAHVDANAPGEEIVEVVVTCDGGVVVLPMDSKREIPDSPGPVTDANGFAAIEPNDADHRARFRTERIEYRAEAGDAFAEGLSEMVVYASEGLGGEPNGAAVGITITAREGVDFVKASNQAVFKGGCVARIPQTDLSVEREAKLSSPRLIVKLPEEGSSEVFSAREVLAEGPVEAEFWFEEPNDANGAGGGVFPVTITAQKWAKFSPDSNDVVFEEECLCTMPWKGGKEGQNYTVLSPKLTVDLAKGKIKGEKVLPDVFWAGPAEMNFFLEDFGGAKEALKQVLPGKLTAGGGARYLAGSRQVVFEGGCEGELVKSGPDFDERYILKAPTITADLPEDANRSSGGGLGGLEHVRAGGGRVTLAQARTAGRKVLGGMMLECRQVDYDVNEPVLTASGPGKITLNNSQIAEPNGEPNSVTLRRPCYAFINNFDTLKYFSDANQIVVDAKTEGAIVVDYMPIRKDGSTGHIVVTATHVEVNVVDANDGGSELSTLTATRGITFEDEAADNWFVGARLFYDHVEGTLTVTGDENQPCNYNGQLVDSILYDLKTGHVRAKVVGPGAIQLKPGSTFNLDTLPKKK